MRAAGIDYEFVATPADLPGECRASLDADLRFLAIAALDGFRIDAALWQPKAKAAADTTLIVAVHGSGGNFSRAPCGLLGAMLATRGYATLSISTRQHDALRNTENFFDVRRDLEAAVCTARALGYRAIVLWGHSLGNIHVQFYAATTWDRDLRAVVLTGMFANLPWRSRYLLIQDEDAYRRLFDAALQSLRDGTETEVMPVRMRRTSSTQEPVTGRHFLTYRAQETSAADGTYWIRRIPRPVLMVVNESDALATAYEPAELLAAARAPDSLVPRIDYLRLPDPANPHPPPFDLRGHSFIDNGDALADAMVEWLGARHRQDSA